MGEYNGYRGFFYSRRQWIFTLMALLFVADIIDTLIKGSDYRARLGLFFELRTAAYLLLSLTAIKVRSPRFHAFFAVFSLTTEILLISKFYLTIH